MDVDSGAPPKNGTDDLSKYNLDEYDDDVKSSGEVSEENLLTSLLIFWTSSWAIYQY